MATILKVTAHFRRVVQPASYESAEASMTVEASFAEGEYNAGEALQLLAEAKSNVLKALNLAPGVDTASIVTTETANGEPKPVERKPRTTKAKADQAAVTDEKPATTTTEAPKVEEVKKIADEELQKAANAAAQKVGAEKVKNVMKDFGVARLGDLKQDVRQDFLDKMKDLKKDEPKNDEIPI